jgi:5-methyltetrahydropteroyltriglutamate--homocysteine methyltransferase
MEAKRLKPAYRADQVGSFLRPQELLEAREQHRQGNLVQANLRALEDRIIIDLVRMQEEVGLSVFSDGEVRREAWYSGFNEAVEGLELVPGARTTTMVWHRMDGTEFRLEPGAMAEAAVRKLRPKKRITAHESQFLAKYAPGPYKITLPSPVVSATFIYREGVSNAAYTRDELLADVTSIMRRELKALSDEGVPYVQVDEGFTRMVSQG